IEVARLVATALRDRGVVPPSHFRRLAGPVSPGEVVWPTTPPY
ncbi:MAG: rhamnogalacturonan acetylesterase, partial [Saccharothrix sp.]|nr:rhamnogalacturonan acetylesterase [Saccharothrix sp.]